MIRGNALSIVLATCLGALGGCLVPTGDAIEEQSGAALEAAEGPGCKPGQEDVNDCGWDLDECTYLRDALIQDVRGCCGPGQRQGVNKLFWDCNGDGNADCEIVDWIIIDDPTCGPAAGGVLAEAEPESSSE